MRTSFIINISGQNVDVVIERIGNTLPYIVMVTIPVKNISFNMRSDDGNFSVPKHVGIVGLAINEMQQIVKFINQNITATEKRND